MRKILISLKNVFYISLPTLIILLIILELFFRFIIPASNPPRGYFNENEKMYSFSNSKKTGLYTVGKFAEIQANWSINNMNWNYPIDYSPTQSKKLISVIGDSYVEAFQVDVDKSYPFLLRKKLNRECEVYAFGKSGAPLSQYLFISRYVNTHFNPAILVFNIVHNDFDESIVQLEPSRNYFLKLSFNPDEDSFTEIDPVPNFSFPQYNVLKRTIYKSALFRYLKINLKIEEVLRSYKYKDYKFEENIDSKKIKEKQNLIFKSTEYLIRTIVKENLNKRVIFVFDAPRFAIYNNELENSSVTWMHDMMREICGKYNTEFIDLTLPMFEDYMKNKKKFNSEIDGHWNEYGHEFVSNVLYEYLQNY